MIRITVVVENSTWREGVQAEHGFCVHIEKDGRSVLFDTGQSDMLLSNARALNIALDGLDAIVLSHGHYDHTNGLSSLLPIAPKAAIYLHPDAFAPKYARRPDGAVRFIGMNPDVCRKLQDHPGRIFRTFAPTQILHDIVATGEVPRRNTFEDVGGAFFLDSACTQPDTLPDDQALVIDQGEKLAVILGCAHAGVINTLEHIRGFKGDKPVSVVIGGMHLWHANDERIAHTIDYFKGLDLSILAPAHCTGWAATAQLLHAFPSVGRGASVGTRFDLSS